MRFEYESKNGLLCLFIFGFSSQSELLSDILYFIWQLQIEISREDRTGKYEALSWSKEKNFYG